MLSKQLPLVTTTLVLALFGSLLITTLTVATERWDGISVCVDHKTRNVFAPTGGNCPPNSTLKRMGLEGAKGDAGTQIYSGDSDPLTSSGSVGDFFINLNSGTLFGPKLEEGWPSPISLRGKDGANGYGSPGPAGPSGAAGPQGPAGASRAGAAFTIEVNNVRISASDAIYARYDSNNDGFIDDLVADGTCISPDPNDTNPYECLFFEEDFYTRVFDANAIDENGDGVTDVVFNLDPGYYMVTVDGEFRGSTGSVGGYCDIISASSNTDVTPSHMVVFRDRGGDESESSRTAVIRIRDGEHLALACASNDKGADPEETVWLDVTVLEVESRTEVARIYP